jgi:hypothetical protein
MRLMSVYMSALSASSRLVPRACISTVRQLAATCGDEEGRGQVSRVCVWG